MTWRMTSRYSRVFLEPGRVPHSHSFLSAIELQRPHFLDQDLRLLFPADGNRAVLFTLVCQDDRPIFQGDMERQVFWWKKNRFPEMTDISAMSDMDGILIDIDGAHEKAENWQDRFAGFSEDIPFISFADVHMQRRWLMLTMPDDYAAKALNWI